MTGGIVFSPAGGYSMSIVYPSAVLAGHGTGVMFMGALNTADDINRINDNASRSSHGGGGTQLNSKTVWKGSGKERIDVENPNPSQRQGQVHYQDNNGNKYIYDPTTGSFKNAPQKVNDLLNNPSFKKGIEKGLKYLGY